jgi:hypothetical protein
VQLHTFLTSALDGGEWWVSATVASLKWKIPGTHWLGSWVGSRAGHDAAGKKENLSCPCKNQIPIPWSSSPYPSHCLSYPDPLYPNVSHYSEAPHPTRILAWNALSVNVLNFLWSFFCTNHIDVFLVLVMMWTVLLMFRISLLPSSTRRSNYWRSLGHVSADGRLVSPSVLLGV